MKLQSTETGFQLEGELVFSTVTDVINDAIKSLKNTQSDSVSVDCEKLKRIDSAGLALMLEWKQWCNENNKNLSLNNLGKQAQSLIETYRLQQVL